jgi:glycosyltransferase involved in cell wall biosynthesis
MPDRSLHVLHVAEVIKGGICTYLRELIRTQCELYGPQRITVVVPARQAHELQAPVGVVIVAFADGGGRARNALRAAQAACRQIGRRRPDIVHVHSTFAGALMRPLLAIRWPRLPVVYCPHGWAFFRDQSRLARALTQTLERVWARWCDAIVCVSRHERRSALRVGVSVDKLHVIPNGLARRRPVADGHCVQWPAGVRRLLFVGRFDRQKGIDVLLAALRQLGPQVFAYIIGDSLHTELSELPANASYAGWKSGAALEAYYASAEIVVMPSRWEGLPLVGLEAMRAGRAIIASEVGGIPELVDPGVTGLLIPPDDIAALVAAVRSLDDTRLEAMGQAASERFEDRWTSEASHRALAALYRHRAGRSRGAPESWYRDFASMALLCGAVILATPAPAQAFEWGACTHLALQRGNAADVLAGLQGAGFTSLRDDVYWGPVETTAGQLTFPDKYRELDRAVDGLARSGGSPLLILDYGNDLYDGGGLITSPAGIDAFERYVRFVVTHFGSRVNQYEVWNEWNSGFGSKPPTSHGDPVAYARLLARTYATIKSVNPHARVIGGALAGVDIAWSQAFFAAGGLNSLDAFSVHSYTLFHAHSNPEVAIKALDALRVDMQRAAAGRQIPVLVTEMGWPTNQGRFGVSEAKVSDYLVRFLAMVSARPWIQGVWWYDLTNDGTDLRESEQNFGLRTADQHGKAAYRTAAQAGPLLSASTDVHSYRLAGDGYAVSGRSAKDGQWLIAWKLEPEVRDSDEGAAAATDTGDGFDWTRAQLPADGSPRTWRLADGRWQATDLLSGG